MLGPLGQVGRSHSAVGVWEPETPPSGRCSQQVEVPGQGEVDLHPEEAAVDFLTFMVVEARAGCRRLLRPDQVFPRVRLFPRRTCERCTQARGIYSDSNLLGIPVRNSE